MNHCSLPDYPFLVTMLIAIKGYRMGIPIKPSMGIRNKKLHVSEKRRLWKLIIMHKEVRHVEEANADDNMNEEIEVIGEMEPVATENIEEVDRVVEAGRVYGKKSYDKYSSGEKYALALEVKSCKMYYDEEVESMEGKTQYYCPKRKRHVQSTPKGGYLSILT